MLVAAWLDGGVSLDGNPVDVAAALAEDEETCWASDVAATEEDERVTDDGGAPPLLLDEPAAPDSVPLAGVHPATTPAHIVMNQSFCIP